MEFTLDDTVVSRYGLKGFVLRLFLRTGLDRIVLRLWGESSLIHRRPARSYPPDKYGKRDSVPWVIERIARLTDRGTSVFITDLEDRGPENRMKAEYMKAFTKGTLESFRTMIRTRLLSADDATLLDRVIDLTYILHFGDPPEKTDREYIGAFTTAFSDFSFGSIRKRVWFEMNRERYKKRILERITGAKPGSIVHAWVSNGYFTAEDVVVEFGHNVLAMTMQWYSLAAAIQDAGFEIGDVYAFLNRKAFAPFVSSRGRDRKVVYSLTNTSPLGAPVSSVPRRKCPFSPDHYTAQHGEVVVYGHDINTDPRFTAFGWGYRRCAGEALTMIFIEELLKHRRAIPDPVLATEPWGFGIRKANT